MGPWCTPSTRHPVQVHTVSICFSAGIVLSASAPVLQGSSNDLNSGVSHPSSIRNLACQQSMSSCWIVVVAFSDQETVGCEADSEAPASSWPLNGAYS